jgi:hypothetical protein
MPLWLSIIVEGVEPDVPPTYSTATMNGSDEGRRMLADVKSIDAQLGYRVLIVVAAELPSSVPGVPPLKAYTCALTVAELVAPSNRYRKNSTDSTRSG